MGCHGNSKISCSPNEFLLEEFFSRLVGPSKQFGTHEKFSAGWGRGCARLAKLAAGLIIHIPDLSSESVETSHDILNTFRTILFPAIIFP